DVEQAVDLLVGAGHLDHERIGRDVDDTGTEDVDELHDLRARLHRGGHLDERQVAVHGRQRRDVLDAQDVHELVDVRLDARGRRRFGIDDERHARDAARVGVPDGQRLDVVAAPSDERRHAVEHTRLVFHVQNVSNQHDNRSTQYPMAWGPTPTRLELTSRPALSARACALGFGLSAPAVSQPCSLVASQPRSLAASQPYLSAPVSASGDGRRIILCRSAPAGTIGNTESSCSTRKSMRTAPWCLRAASTVGTTSLRASTRCAWMPNDSASLTKSGLSSGVAAYRRS